MDIGRRDKHGYRIIDIVGKVDRLKDSLALKDHVTDLVYGGVKHVALNLSHVTYLDSGALNVLIYCLNLLDRSGGKLVLLAPNEYVTDVLKVVGIDKLLTIYLTEEEFENEVQKS